MCLLDLLQEKGKGGVPCECHVLFLGLLFGDANVEKRGDNQEKKLFMDNTVRTLIPFKERQRPIETTCTIMGGSIGVEKKKRKEFSSKWKNKEWEAIQNLLKSCMSFGSPK